MIQQKRSFKWWVATLVPAVALSAVALGAGVMGSSSVRAQSATTVLVAQNATLNEAVLTDSSGMTLYTYSRDTAGVSNCNGGCATTWPPLQASSSTLTLPDGATGMLSVITRSDGSSQVAYNGMPLYDYSKDSQPGDATGQGVGGVWAAATP